MRIDDYNVGTAYIILTRSKFKYEEDFDELLHFLKLPLNYDRIDIEVCEGGYKGYTLKGGVQE